MTAFLGFDLLGNDNETGGDDLVLVLDAVGNEKFLHGSLSVICARRARLEEAPLESENAQFFLLFLEFFGAGVLGGGFDGLGLVRTGASIHVTGFDVDEGLFAQL